MDASIVKAWLALANAFPWHDWVKGLEHTFVAEVNQYKRCLV